MVWGYIQGEGQTSAPSTRKLSFFIIVPGCPGGDYAPFREDKHPPEFSGRKKKGSRKKLFEFFIPPVGVFLSFLFHGESGYNDYNKGDEQYGKNK
jgi:hypothetical protein